MMLYLRLFYEFFKTGLFAVGGGMATIPFLYDIAEFLNEGFPAHLRILSPPTCVGLRYGRILSR